MPAIITNAPKFLVNSDFPLDKIVYMTSGSLTVTNAMFTPGTTIKHGLPYKPLIIGTYSLTSDFAISKSAYYPQYPDPVAAYLSVQARNADDIMLFPVNTTSGTVTIYYRIYGFMPSDVNVEQASTATQADNFTLNLDYNYTKLFEAGIVPVQSSTKVIDHNLGYKPKVDIWSETVNAGNTIVKHIEEGYPNPAVTSANRIEITDTQLIFWKGSSVANIDKHHYRIYLD